MSQTPPPPIYADILNQANALRGAYRRQTEFSWRSLQLAADMIRSARQVVMVAVGASLSASIPFVYRMASAGLAIRLEDASELIYFTHQAYPTDTLFILVSRSGETIEIVKAAQALKAQKRRFIGVTNETGSTLATLADIALLIGGPSDSLISIQTYQTTLLTLHHLSEYVIGNPGSATFSDGIHKMIDRVQATLDKFQAISQDWKNSFTNCQAVYLLGRGYSLASAKQGSLLFHEMGRLPGIAFSAGEFRHGPWEALDGRMRAFVFALSDQTFDLNISLASDLCALGSQVTLIASRSPQEFLSGQVSLDELDLWEIPAGPVELTPFVEILPLEFYIYEYACWQGLTPGVFRACTPITLAETGSLVTRR